jgi:hypothetical protein
MSVMPGTYQDNIGGITIDMSNALHTLTANPTTTTAQTMLSSRLIFVDANGGAQDLVMPAEADYFGEFTFVNTGGETVSVQTDALADIVVIATAEIGKVWCNGTTAYGSSGVA